MYLNRNTENDEYFEIDILRLLKALWHRAWIIVLAALLCAAIGFYRGNKSYVPTYRATALLHINSGSLSLGSTTISMSEMSTSANLVSRYIIIIKSRTTLNQVIARAGLPYSYARLSGMISASGVDNTEFFNITVTSTDPEEAALIANTMAEVLPGRVEDIMEGSSVKVVDYAVVPYASSGSNVTRYTSTGLMIGAVISSAVIILLELFNEQIKDDKYLIQTYNLPVLATIPDLSSSGKGKKYYKSYYSYGYGAHSYASQYASAAERKKS